MESYTIIVLIFGLVCLLVFILLYFINCILQYRSIINNSFLGVKKILNDRVDIVGEMIIFLETNLEYEKSYLKKLQKAKEVIKEIKNNKEGIESIKETRDDVFSFVELENTYKKLTKNKVYNQIKEGILKNEERLIYAIDIYDKGVIRYNSYRGARLIYWLSKLCRIPDYDCYNK